MFEFEAVTPDAPPILALFIRGDNQHADASRQAPRAQVGQAARGADHPHVHFIVKCEPGPDGLGRVTFTYRKSGSRRLRAMTVTAEEFIRRFLQHVLPGGFQKVRHYGFAHPRQRIDCEWLKMLVTVTLNAVYVLDVVAPPWPVRHGPACPHCGAELTYIGFVPEHDWSFVTPDTS